jgi:hypothetical protein
LYLDERTGAIEIVFDPKPACPFLLPCGLANSLMLNSGTKDDFMSDYEGST